MPADLAVVTPHFVPARTMGATQALRYRRLKPAADLALALLALPIMAMIGLALLVLNPLLNPGPLIYRQRRLGQNRQPFMMYKFRSMRPAGLSPRGPCDALEDDRITPLGQILRRTRIDELPNFLNVLRGEMSAIGPRPDAAHHAAHFLEVIPHYHHRFRVKPGITGLAQILSGYAEGIEATAEKAHYDRLYVESRCARLDLQIALRTVGVIFFGRGAK